jgi:hypothetical protein
MIYAAADCMIQRKFKDTFGCTTCPELDFNGDGLVNVSDIVLYLDLIDG